MAKRPTQKRDGRAKIIDGAIRCFIKNGVAQTSLKEITDAAGVDQPLFHYHFKSLDELYAEVGQAVRASLGAASIAILEKETNPMAQMKKYIEGTLGWGRKNPGLYSIWIYFYYLGTYQPTFAALSLSIRKVGRERVELFIHRGIEQGLFKLPAGVSVNEAGYCIHTLLTGALVLGGSGGNQGDEWDKAVARTIAGAMLWLGADAA